MAKEKKEKTPGYEEFHDALQSGAVGNVYIFHGEETYLMQQAVAELQARLVPAGFEEFNYHRLAGKGLTMQEVVEAAEAMPMMAERTLVTVEDMDLFRLDEAQRGALVALLEDFPEYCTLVFLYRQIPYKTDVCPAGTAEAAKVGAPPFCRCREGYRCRHGRPSAVHLRQPDDRSGAGNRQNRCLCQGSENHSGGYRRCGGPCAGRAGVRHDGRSGGS